MTEEHDIAVLSQGLLSRIVEKLFFPSTMSPTRKRKERKEFQIFDQNRGLNCKNAYLATS